jgi:hypothetical protein
VMVRVYAGLMVQVCCRDLARTSLKKLKCRDLVPASGQSVRRHVKNAPAQNIPDGEKTI